VGVFLHLAGRVANIVKDTLPAFSLYAGNRPRGSYARLQVVARERILMFRPPKRRFHIMALRKFIIERDIPAVGSFEREQLKGTAAQSNKVLAQLGPDIQWQESYVAADKTFCVYLAKDEATIKKHAELSGFPATKITEVRKMIDPTTEKDGA